MGYMKQLPAGLPSVVPHPTPLPSLGALGTFLKTPFRPPRVLFSITAPTDCDFDVPKERGSAPRAAASTYDVAGKLLAPLSLQLPKIWRTDGEPATGGRLLMATSFASRSPRACARRSTPPVRTSGTTAQCCAPGSKKLRKQVLFG